MGGGGSKLQGWKPSEGELLPCHRKQQIPCMQWNRLRGQNSLTQPCESLFQAVQLCAKSLACPVQRGHPGNCPGQVMTSLLSPLRSGTALQGSFLA